MSTHTDQPMASPANDQVVPKRILIVEDNDLNIKLFRDLLLASGYTVYNTRDGVEAFRLARTHKPDLVVMDLQLPEFSGIEVTRWLKDEPSTRDIPVLAVTAFAMAGDEERALGAGCAAYITKPIAVKGFLEMIAKMLSEPMARSPELA